MRRDRFDRVHHFIVQLLCRGVEWTLHKRYRDFYNLHHELIKENQNYNIDLPKLPEKRWFERQRWINRYGSKFPQFGFVHDWTCG